MKKLMLLVTFSLTGWHLMAQPRCFIVGPAYSFGKAGVENFTFTRNYAAGTEGQPTYTFTELGNLETKSRSVGLMMDIYTKHSRVAFDLMFPLKNTPANVFNFCLAFGGYIKGKVGIMAGISSFSNTKFIKDVPTDPSYGLLSLSPDLTSSGKFYNNNFVSQAIGVNALLNYAFNETIVLSFDYGIYAANIDSKQQPMPENYDFSQTSSRKFEARLCLQVPGEPFGLSLKYMNWNTTGTYNAELDYTYNGNTQTTTADIFPERKYKLNSLMIALMIPLGNASTTSGTITVLE